MHINEMSSSLDPQSAENGSKLPEETPEERSYRELRELFMRHHREIMDAPGVIGFSMKLEESGPITITLENTDQMKEVRKAVRAACKEIGLRGKDIKFKQRTYPVPAISQKPADDMQSAGDIDQQEQVPA